MAGKGTFTAYQQLNPIKEDFGNNMLQAEQMDFKYREEERRKQALEDQKRKEDIQLSKEAAQDISSVQPVITGIRSVDEINYRATGMAQKRIGDIYREFRSNPKAQSDVALRMELANLKAFPKILDSAEKKIKTYAEGLAKGFADGTYSKWDQGKLDELEAFFGVTDENGNTTPNYIIDFDKNGNMVAKGITKDGRYFTKSINDVINGYQYSDATPAVDAEKYTDDIAKSLGKKTTSRVGGGFITDSQTFDSVEGPLRNTVRASLGDYRNPSAIAKSIWADEGNMNMDPADFGPDSIRQIEEFIISKVKNKYDETEKKRQLSTSGSGSGDKQKRAGESIRLMTDPATGEPLRPLAGPDLGSYSFSIGEPVTFRVGNKEKKFNTIYLDDKGNVMFKGEEREFKNPNVKTGGTSLLPGDPEPAFKPTYAGVLTLEETNNLAVQLGFDNATQLRQYLEDRSPEQKQDKASQLRNKYNY